MSIAAKNAGYAIDGRALIEGIDLELSPERLTVIIGPNGAGKSTLLRLLTAELKPTSGEVTLDGTDIGRLAAFDIARRRAVVSQQTTLSFPFTVVEVAELGITVPGLMPAGPRARRLALLMLERVGLAALAHRAYPTLSGGERQRVHIARALGQLEAAALVESKLGRAGVATLFVDEPTSSLDVAHQLMVLGELRRQARSGLAVLAVLHDLNLAAGHADEIILLAGGRMLARGRPSEVLVDGLLSQAYDCEVRVNRVPSDGIPFLLPQACQLSGAESAH